MNHQIAIVALSVSFVSVPALAESTTQSSSVMNTTSEVIAASTSQNGTGATGIAETTLATVQPVPNSGFLSKTSVSLWGIYNGPALGNSSRFVANPDGTKSDTKQNFDAILSAKYAISERLSIAPVFAFMYAPVGGHEFQIKDPFLSIGFKNFLPKGSRFDLSVDLRVIAGTSESAIAKGRVLGIRSSQSLNYKVGRLTVGTYTFVRTNFYASDRPAQGNLNFYLAPNASYRLTPKLAATFWYDMGATHMRGETLTNFGSDGTTLQTGVNWDVTDSVAVNPYINFYPGETITLENTSLGMILSARLL